MLPKVICAEKLFAAVALPKLVHFLEVANALFPVLVGSMARCGSTRASPVSRELLTTVSTRVCFTGAIRTVVERTIIAIQGRATPAVSANVKTILVAFGLILVLESISAERTFILLLGFVRPVDD